LIPFSPFAFDATFHKPDHFASGDNFFEPGVRWQTCRWKELCLGLKFENKGTIKKPIVLLSVYGGKELDEGFLDSLVKEIRYRYNLDLDLSDYYSQFKNDKVLGQIIKKWWGMRPGHANSLYEYLMR